MTIRKKNKQQAKNLPTEKQQAIQSAEHTYQNTKQMENRKLEHDATEQQRAAEKQGYNPIWKYQRALTKKMKTWPIPHSQQRRWKANQHYTRKTTKMDWVDIDLLPITTWANSTRNNAHSGNSLERNACRPTGHTHRKPDTATTTQNTQRFFITSTLFTTSRN